MMCGFKRQYLSSVRYVRRMQKERKRKGGFISGTIRNYFKLWT